MPFRPHDAAIHALQRAEDLLSAASTQGVPAAVGADMRRSSVVLAVSALDTYMHRLIVDRSSMWGALPPKLAGAEVRFDQLVEEGRESYEAARRKSFKSRPGVRVKRVLRDQLLFRTFQSMRGIEEALTMAEASGNWGPIGAQMGKTKQEIEDQLGPIVTRRNQIVHEGDYLRMERPRQPQLNGVTQAEARNDIQFLRDLVNAIHAVI